MLSGGGSGAFWRGCARRKRIWIKKESWIKRKIRMEQVLGKKWERRVIGCSFCECVFHVPVPESGESMCSCFCFGSLPVLRKKCIAETGLSGHLCWWQPYGMFYPVRFQRRSAWERAMRGRCCACQCSSWRAYIMKSRRNWHRRKREYIETLIDPQALSEYVRVNADPVKSGFHTEVMQADMGRFVRTWAEIGKRHPDIYLDSFLMGNWGVLVSRRQSVLDQLYFIRRGVPGR